MYASAHTRAHVACGVAALLGCVVYLNALRNPFVYDDHRTVVENRSIAEVTNIRAIVQGALTRPVVNFSYALDRAIWGTEQAGPKNPLGYHVTNVLLHVLNVVLLFQLARKFGLDEFSAFAASALLAVHPMMSEAVGYISGRSEALCATFFIVALLCGRNWIGARQTDRPTAAWAALTIAFWIAALASKESAATFPFVFLAYDWLGAGGSASEKRRRLLTIHAPMMGAAVAGGIGRLFIFSIEYPGQTAIHWNYALLELDVVRRYLWMMVIPTGQSLFHEVAAVSLFSPRVWFAGLVLASLMAAAWTLRTSNWAASFGLLWFLLLLAPSSALIALDQGEPMAEHRVYIASCGLFLSAGVAFGALRSRLHRADFGRVRASAAIVLALTIVSFSAQTLLRNAVWSTPVTLWGESVDLAPTHYRPRLLLGEALQDAGRRDEAIAQYQEAIRLRPAEPTAYVKIGQCLAEIGQWADARQQFLKAIDLDPKNRVAHDSLAVLNNVESRFGVDGSHR